MPVADVLIQYHPNVKVKFANTKKSSYVKTAEEFLWKKKWDKYNIRQKSILEATWNYPVAFLFAVHPYISSKAKTHSDSLTFGIPTS